MRRVSVLSFLGILFLSTMLVAAPITTELAVGTVTTVLSTELNSLGNNAFSVASGIMDNRIGQTLNGYLICRIEGKFTFAASPTANTGVSGWFLKNVDATNYEDTPTSSIALGRAPDFVLPVTTGQTATRVIVDIMCPAERFKVVAKNDGTGQAMSASANTIKVLPVTWQGN